MKLKHRSLYLKVAALVVALSFGLSARAESPRDEMAHAYVLLKMAKNDYGGHKAEAIRQLELASHDIALDLHGRETEHERQLKSDELISHAADLLHGARNKLETRDRERAAAHLDVAIREIDAALKVH
jgi:hypothetical protein